MEIRGDHRRTVGLGSTMPPLHPLHWPKLTNMHPPPSETDPAPWHVETSIYLSRKPWLTLRQDRVRLPGGAVIDEYFVLEYPAWVNVLAIAEDGRVVLIRQYRHAAKGVHYELPAGVVDPTDPDPLTAAKRELLEETGYGGGEWTAFMTLSANPATHTNVSHTFLARGVVPVQSPDPEATEDIAVHLVSAEELRRIAIDGGMLQSLHAAPVLKYLLST